MKVKTSKIAFISFHFLFRIETFQWVMGEKNKKICLGLNSRDGLSRGVFPSFPPPRSARRRRALSGEYEIYSTLV
jgi:hypothetical protein